MGNDGPNLLSFDRPGPVCHPVWVGRCACPIVTRYVAELQRGARDSICQARFVGTLIVGLKVDVQLGCGAQQLD